MFLFPTVFRSPELPGMDMSIVIFAPAESQWTIKNLPPRNPTPGTLPHTHRGEMVPDQAETPPNPLKIQSLPTETQATARKSNLGAAERCSPGPKQARNFWRKGEISIIDQERGQGSEQMDQGWILGAYLKPATPVLNREDFVHTAELVCGYDRRERSL